MRLHIRYLVLTLATLPIFSVGCSATKQHQANSDSSQSPHNYAGNTQPLNEIPSPEYSGMPTQVQAVAYSDDDADNVADDSLDASIQFPVSIEVDTTAVSAVGMTLEAIEQLALANNPAIQQAVSAAARAGGIRTQVGLKPNPTVGYNATQLGDDGTDQHTLFFEQTFVRGDKLAWNQQVIDHDVNAMNWHAETQRHRIITDVRLAFYSALAAQKRLQLARDFLSIAKEGVAVSEERVNAKVGTRPDVLQSEIQLNEVNLSIQQAEFELSAAFSELAALTGVPDLRLSELVGELDSAVQPRDADTEYAKISSTSPQLSAAQARVDRARANLRRQQVQPISNVTAQLGAGHDNGTGQGLVNVQLSLPLPVHNKNQGNIRAAHAEYCAATQNVERVRQSIRRDLARVMREYNIAEASVQQYERSILPKAEETLKLMQEAQAAGEFDFLRVLTARRAYFDANLRYVKALGDLAQADAKIDGLLLSDGLSNVVTYDIGDDLRGQTLSGQ